MNKTILIGAVVVLNFLMGSSAFAAAPSFTVNSLTASYYLDRNSTAVSTLVAEEVFNIQFPSGGASSTGFTRSIPTRYLKNSNDLRIIAVTDASGASVPYKTNYDADKNLILAIGNPGITLFGGHTFSIRYQAKGVINFLSDHDEFYPNFNGRGWQQGFGAVAAVIHLSNSLAAQMMGNPQCFIDAGRCQFVTEKKGNETQITVRSLNQLAANQSLSAKLDFKKGTFKPYKQNQTAKNLKLAGLIVAVILGLLLVIAASRTALTRLWRRDESATSSTDEHAILKGKSGADKQ